MPTFIPVQSWDGVGNVPVNFVRMAPLNAKEEHVLT